MEIYQDIFLELLKDVLLFCEIGSGLKLRRYQEQVACAVVDSVINRRGLAFVVMFPRQSGKNELQAQIETYLLAVLSTTCGELVKVSPTWKPQSQNAMRRLERVLRRNVITQNLWSKEQGYIYRVGEASLTFLSGEPTSSIVGATASRLLEVDEAQDVLIAKYDKEIAPMAASTDATRVFWGTAWTSHTLLGRELRLARQGEQRDGLRRVFVLSGPEVAQEVPAYGRFVDEQVRRLGRDNPLVRTQLFSEEVDAQSGMFPAARRALMQGDHAQIDAPRPGRIYALLLDVAGEDEALRGDPDGDGSAGGADFGRLSNPGRDATALTIVEVDLSQQDLTRAPVYRAVCRRQWLGVKHTLLLGQLSALAEAWGARWLVVDATGVGAGLASFLDRALPGRVIPFVFSPSSKSRLGWEFLAVVETGRFRDWQPGSGGEDRLQQEFSRQLEACEMEALPGPERRMRWGVPDGRRDPASGELLHDDLLLSAALCAVLDGKPWGVARSAVVPAPDLLVGLGKAF